MGQQVKFLSTPSGWRATFLSEDGVYNLVAFLSTPSGWRATFHHVSIFVGFHISIHALRVEGDIIIFLVLTPHIQIISIHALRVEGDISLHRCSR